ncbi:MAG: hypothetical protein GQ477_04220 [Nanohaloarchaea archaeon]|nr:hypothetical protein [Candidatus Nanohaloarchaea archaeon]
MENEILYMEELEANLGKLGNYDLSQISEAVVGKLDSGDDLYKHCKVEEFGDRIFVTLQNGVPSVITLTVDDDSKIKVLYREKAKSPFPTPSRNVYQSVSADGFYGKYFDGKLINLHEVVSGILGIVSQYDNNDLN